VTACRCGATRRTADRADDAAVTTLLNCYLREAGGPVVDGDLIALPRLGLRLFARTRHRSATGRHAWTLPVRLAVHPGLSHADGCAAGAGPPLPAAALAALIAMELSGTAAAVDVGRLVGAVAESTRHIAAFLDPPPAASGTTPYLAAEQALATGHPLHPTPKSRAPMTAPDVLRYAPELHAAFPLHWFAVDRALVAEDSGLDQPATALLAGLLAADPAVPPDLARAAAEAAAGGAAVGGAEAGAALVGSADSAGRWAYLPAHPWQAARLAARPGVRALAAAGQLVDLGPLGTPWHPTSSVRTVYRPDVPFQLKLTVEARITNSVRRNLRKELARGLEVHRLLDAGLAAEIGRHHPAFGIVRDPAWVTVETAGPAGALSGIGGAPGGSGAAGPGGSGPAGGAGESGFGESGFELVLRENPYPAGSPVDVSVVAALCADPADGGLPRVARLVRRIARATGRGAEPVAREWFERYLRLAADPLLWLYAEWGIALEAHQQNTLLELAGGWPAGLRYRDNQGYYFAASRADRLRALLPTLNEASDTICADAVAEERLGYYLVGNNLLGVIGALGVGGVADERVLLVDLASHLRATAADLPLVRRLVTDPELRGKANLRTRLADLDELTAPLATQSVYLATPNPIAGWPPAGWPA
jgi:siderophore synthetase component